MIFAIYRRAEPGLGWSFACSCDVKSAADSLKKSEQKRLKENGYTQAEVKIEQFKEDKEVKKSLPA